MVNEPIVHDAILASATHPYFELRWITINPKWNQEEKREYAKKNPLQRAIDISVNPSTASDTASNASEDSFAFHSSPTDPQETSSLDEANSEVIASLNDMDRALSSLEHPIIRILWALLFLSFFFY